MKIGNSVKGSLILITAALIWGLAFVAQNSASDYAPPFIINCLRSFISAVFLFCILLITGRGKKFTFIPESKREKAVCLKGGIVCGITLGISVNFQQFGIAFYPENVPTEARSGFLTALYVLFVPIFSVFLKKKIFPAVWAAVAVAIIGFYMLCFWEGASGIYLGDLLMLLCAVACALHILAVDKFVGTVGGIRLSMLQFLVCGVISGLLSFVFEHSQVVLQDVLFAGRQILYLGIMSSGIAYTLQIIGLKYAEPTAASISMSLESVFAALGGWLISGNGLTVHEIIGCGLVFAAIIIAQIPEMVKSNT